VGRALIEATTHENNVTARALYDRLGGLTEFVQYRR